MRTLKLEFVVKDDEGNVLAVHEVDYVDEYNLASRHTQQRFANVATIAVKDAKKKMKQAEHGYEWCGAGRR
jgi:hypothetical protein